MHLSLGYSGPSKDVSRYLVHIARGIWPEACARYKDEYYTNRCAKIPLTFVLDPVIYQGKHEDSVVVEVYDGLAVLTVDNITENQRNYFKRLYVLPFWTGVSHVGA
jgi:hypothetical protein